MWTISQGKSCHINYSHWKNRLRWLISKFFLESRQLKGREGSSLLVHAFTTLLIFSLSVFPFTLHFFSFWFLCYLFSFLSFCFFSFSLFLTYFSLLSLVLALSPFLLCTTNALLYCLPWWVLLFYPSTTFVRVWVFFLDHPLVCRLPNYHHFPVLAMPHSIPKQKCCFVFLLYVAFPSG